MAPPDGGRKKGRTPGVPSGVRHVQKSARPARLLRSAEWHSAEGIWTLADGQAGAVGGRRHCRPPRRPSGRLAAGIAPAAGAPPASSRGRPPRRLRFLRAGAHSPRHVSSRAIWPPALGSPVATSAAPPAAHPTRHARRSPAARCAGCSSSVSTAPRPRRSATTSRATASSSPRRRVNPRRERRPLPGPTWCCSTRT